LTSEHLSSEEHLMSKFWRVWTWTHDPLNSKLVTCITFGA
jgi:hypothetical protein